MPERSQDRIETVSVRRAPKISVFLILGAALGVLVAMILTFAFNGTAEASPNTGGEYSQGQVFGFLTLICVPVGLALGGIVALVLDRRSRRRTREIAVDHESVHVDPESGADGRGSVD
ncbi:potassium transporter Trk [Microbacterium hibisci]|uniref:potassium transporter Trk n=1 Tax=Microbacterium hibisci TaxID=2036000 RepID=UPI00194045DE|nr:potassium transporter Trk [Microbacterium hibisci]